MLTFDKQSNRFNIVDIYLGTIITSIPQDYMTLHKDGNLNEELSRFKWLTLNQMQIMSKEKDGIEKIIEYCEETKCFKENSFNVRHLYEMELDNHEENWENYTYYSNWRAIENEDNIKHRLIRFV